MDGRYPIDPDGDTGPATPFTVFCDRMAPGSEMPREYIEVDPANNFRQSLTTGLLDGPLCRCAWFRRSFSKLRLLISPPPIRYSIETFDFTYSTRTLGPQNPDPGAGRCPVAEGAPFPEDDYQSVCNDRAISVTPNAVNANSYGRVESCTTSEGTTATLGQLPGARVQLVGSGFRVSREDIAGYVASGNRQTHNFVMSVNNGRGFEAQTLGFCASINPPGWNNETHHVLNIERDLPVRESLGESCESPWLLETTHLGGDVDSSSAPATGLCLSEQYARKVRYYELRVPASRSRTVTVSDMTGSDVLVRVLDRCGASECVAQSSAQPLGNHTLMVQNTTDTDRSYFIAVSGKTEGNSFYRIVASPPR